jgi:hypothetical protein
MPELTIATGTEPHDVDEVVKVPELRTLRTATPAVRHEHRAAILSSLYDERHRLNRSKRLGQATANDLEYLTELNAYISDWERAEVREAQQRDSAIWARLDEVAASLVALKAKAKYEK